MNDNKKAYSEEELLGIRKYFKKINITLRIILVSFILFFILRISFTTAEFETSAFNILYVLFGLLIFGLISFIVITIINLKRYLRSINK